MFFDEANALFGSRSEVQNAHDRFANSEVAYLLQRVEKYDGIVVLATNLLDKMDEAFIRYLHQIVKFPFPDMKERTRIWERYFPSARGWVGTIDCGY